MRVLLVSTYELGEQPIGIAARAGTLREAGHETRAADLSLGPLTERDLAWADAMAVSVPMHTALRLALEVVASVRVRRPDVPIALHGLYAPVAVGHEALRGTDLLAAGDVDSALPAWLARLDAGNPGAEAPEGQPAAQVAVELGPAGAIRRPRPERGGLPGLSRYARLVTGEGEVLAGAVEASVGCSHLCRHCPVPTVWRGRSRAIAAESVLEDVQSLVEAGAGHITFADPDFLNRPRHALEVAGSLHERWPSLTFDVTVKVEHVLRHRGVWSLLGGYGCRFVVSAFESVDDRILQLLAKGHTRAEAVEAVGVLRGAGIEPRPSLLPFTPWTTLEGLVELVDFVSAHDLVQNVDPVQYGIRLLLPPGSLLLADPDRELAASLGEYDEERLTWQWTSADRRLDELQAEIASITERAADEDATVEDTYLQVRRSVYAAAGRGTPDGAGERNPSTPPGPPGVRPHLSEAWFCCAEPTGRQLAAVDAR